MVLVDRGTAGSPELLAAALDNERALLVGEATYGKGLIQRVFPLPDGGELKLTIGEYLRPTKQHVRRGVGGGIQPDLRCAATPWGGEGAARFPVRPPRRGVDRRRRRVGRRRRRRRPRLAAAALAPALRAPNEAGQFWFTALQYLRMVANQKYRYYVVNE